MGEAGVGVFGAADEALVSLPGGGLGTARGAEDRALATSDGLRGVGRHLGGAGAVVVAEEEGQLSAGAHGNGLAARAVVAGAGD